ncbi:GspE/PulE family protein [Saliterribacillus persicus]|uniref:Type IV pilus assembly protein PilB n=1 Tax=Saliterribacillus persicus TaxID=930114 RepID=A0A368XEJ8_9BACI|nr:ATPase, T2SS/T4P/T4SS family [Saliterribacillus persicus]RCW66393.1 type IV pilus assembly protein PilB [Saliterribacillus persicus]
MAQNRRKKLGDLLKESGLITEDQILLALEKKKRDQKLGDALLELGVITENQLIEVLEFQLKIPSVSLYNYPMDTKLLSFVSKEFARRNLAIPIKQESNTLTVAMNDPMDYYAIDDLEISTGFQITPVIATKEDILQAINRYYDLNDAKDEEFLYEGDDAPAIRIMDQLLQTGVHLKASDLHIDPNEKSLLVRYRIDGVLRTERTLTKSIQSALTARLKILASLNITESRLPQDGRIRTLIDQIPVDLRISTLPTVFGEKIVIRILNLQNALMKLTDLDFSAYHYEKYQKLIDKPSGLILMTGPTGSGKTSTLYASINQLNQEGVNIITIEDPVEYQLEGINQVQVNSGIGLTFAAGLRSILRQDPNIVMVGEVRDTETAEIAIRASLTGHLVFSTLHTNSAVAAIPRLIDMDIEPYLVVSSLTAVVGQRLVKRICRDCKTEREATEFEKNIFQRRGIDVTTITEGKGCNSCKHTGYKGRMAIHELLVIDDDIRELIIKNNAASKIREYVKEKGMHFLIDDGLMKVTKGYTSVEEVLRVALDE